jgi:hypothetical protein
VCLITRRAAIPLACKAEGLRWVPCVACMCDEDGNGQLGGCLTASPLLLLLLDSPPAPSGPQEEPITSALFSELFQVGHVYGRVRVRVYGRVRVRVWPRACAWHVPSCGVSASARLGRPCRAVPSCFPNPCRVVSIALPTRVPRQPPAEEVGGGDPDLMDQFMTAAGQVRPKLCMSHTRVRV